MRRFALLLGVAALFALGPAPERMVTLDTRVETAEARPGGRGGGFRGGGGRRGGARHGARARPHHGARGRRAARPSRRATRPSRPSIRPSRPSTRPGRPSTRPSRPIARRPDRPGGRVPGSRPPGDRPPGALLPGDRPRPERPIGDRPRPERPIGDRPRPERPIGDRPRPERPIGERPPGNRPPGWRPPGDRPPGWRPPHWRPPNWRPPAYRPPYDRPPHYAWGPYYWYPSWGWYFTAAVAGATLVYVATLPEDEGCEQVLFEGETLFLCDGVLYRATLYQNEQVYEIVSEYDESETAVTDDRPLQLTSPRMRGEDVAALQQALANLDYQIGTIDGVYGPATDRAVREFQEIEGLAVTGVVDADTASLLGL